MVVPDLVYVTYSMSQYDPRPVVDKYLFLRANFFIDSEFNFICPNLDFIFDTSFMIEHIQKWN